MVGSDGNEEDGCDREERYKARCNLDVDEVL